jgi:hypothetical protein
MSTPITPEQKEWIDTASYEDLLWRWRFTPTGDDNGFFTGETGKYYAKVMKQRREAPGGQEEHVRASKKIGW